MSLILDIKVELIGHFGSQATRLSAPDRIEHPGPAQWAQPCVIRGNRLTGGQFND